MGYNDDVQEYYSLNASDILLKILQQQIDEYWSNSLSSLKSSKGWGTNSLGLQFTLPGCDNFELISNGSNIDVTPQSIQQYIDAVILAVLDIGVEKQVQAFREGFNQVFPIDDL